MFSLSLGQLEAQTALFHVVHQLSVQSTDNSLLLTGQLFGQEVRPRFTFTFLYFSSLCSPHYNMTQALLDKHAAREDHDLCERG